MWVQCNYVNLRLSVNCAKKIIDRKLAGFNIDINRSLMCFIRNVFLYITNEIYIIEKF